MSAVLEARDLAVGTDVQIMGEIQPGMPTRARRRHADRSGAHGRRDDRRALQPTRASFPCARRCPETGERLRIEVETSGEGLPVAEREKIFDAFKSAESARRQGGLGLGLQLARSIVEIHGGTIEVDNTDRGGMVFRVWLPVETTARRSARERASRRSLRAEVQTRFGRSAPRHASLPGAAVRR